jgi:hypothetical protein
LRELFLVGCSYLDIIDVHQLQLTCLPFDVFMVFFGSTILATTLTL